MPALYAPSSDRDRGRRSPPGGASPEAWALSLADDSGTRRIRQS